MCSVLVFSYPALHAVVLYCPLFGCWGVLGVISFHSSVVSGGVLSTISTEPTGAFDRRRGKRRLVGRVAELWVGQAKVVFYHLRLEFAVLYH